MTLSPFNFQPVIIIGAARSGTNMLRDLLTQHPCMSTWPCDEINYLWRIGNASFPTDELGVQHATPRTIAYIRQKFSRLAKQCSTQWVIEKTCANSLRVDYVQSIVPEAKFVFLVRDGIDVVASAVKRWQAPLDLSYVLKKAGYVPWQDIPYYAVRYLSHRLRRRLNTQRQLPTWGPCFEGMQESMHYLSIEEVCALQWQRSVICANRSLSTLPSKQVLFVRYEAFTQNPCDELARVLEFIKAEADEESIHNAVRHVSTRNVGKGRQQLSSAAYDSIQPLVDATLQQVTSSWQKNLAGETVRHVA